MMFDVQVKRLHEYKRQQLNALYAIYKYLDILNGNLPARPITLIFGAKAAPAYIAAKDIIHLILCLSKLIESDPVASRYLKIVMLENYNVTCAEKVIPACDISEQISLASKEASGTGNMKFMMNGAITLGTLDGANVEIAELVGPENIKIFGKKAEEIDALRASGSYDLINEIRSDDRIVKIIDELKDGTFAELSGGFDSIYNELIHKNDEFFVIADFMSYIKAYEELTADYKNTLKWKMMLTNIAKAGYFSSDRTIKEYADEIWKM